jgi:hypothetical protein
MRKGMYATVVSAVIGLVMVSGVYAGEVPFELNPQFGVKEVLLGKVGARILVKTDSGETLEGTVTTVGHQLLHLSKITGKDFYDAIVRIDRITSVVMKVR